MTCFSKSSVRPRAVVPAPVPPRARERQREPTSVTFWMSRRDRDRLLDALGTLHRDRSRALLSLVRR